ncbi:MAG: hypothetical protein ACKOJF_29985 [Planctomycetaceae bacterium]
MPQFVVLDHDWPEPHLDLLLENGASLLALRLPKWPDEGGSVCVRRLFDHRLIYLTYEGPISGNRGTARRLFGGQWQLRAQLAEYWDLEMASSDKVWNIRVIGQAASWLSPIRLNAVTGPEWGVGILSLSSQSSPTRISDQSTSEEL